jgi:hypothetical protein
MKNCTTSCKHSDIFQLLFITLFRIFFVSDCECGFCTVDFLSCEQAPLLYYLGKSTHIFMPLCVFYRRGNSFQPWQFRRNLKANLWNSPVYPQYTGCKWKMRENFGHEFHIPKQEKISISRCVRKHLMSELYLEENINNKRSKCPPWDSKHTSTRLIADHHIHSKMPG